jgi:prepilin-type processing-associated H-X9-DG protein
MNPTPPPKQRFSILRVLVLLGIVLLLAILVLPVFPLRHDHGERRAYLGSNMRQFLLAMVTYCSEYGKDGKPGPWPADIASLMVWTDGELVPKLLNHPSNRDIQPAFLYVRPVPDAPADQPVLVSLPYLDSGRCIVAYADGHIENVNASLVWSDAVRLLASDAARGPGVSMSDWTALAGKKGR